MGFKCCVSTCKSTNKDMRLHVFPKCSELFKKWAIAVCRLDILEKGIAKRNNYRVCELHFADSDRFWENRNRTNLKATAVPSLYLPGPSKRMESPQQEEAGTVVCSQREDLRQKYNLLKAVHVRKSAELTPKALKLYKIARGLRQTARRLDFANATNKQRLKEAIEFAESPEFIAAKVNKVSQQFINVQLSMQRKKGKGRRYSTKNKIFALSLLKQSPKAYQLLQKTFALPSRKTLMAVVNKVPFACGLNQVVLNSLKQSIGKMKPLDRYCSLMFDEMTLEASLNYNINKDVVEGFEDYGESGNNMKIADHAMVFMARGLRSKWKQPIAYYFSENGMSAADICRNLKLIIRALHKIGLTVVATVCDQLSINSTAIRMLREETIREHALNGQVNKMFGFGIDGKEVVPLFDPPHLLKDIRNNFLDGRVKFTWKAGEQMGVWKDIIQLYEVDVGDFDTKMLNKLTDCHVYPKKIKKMKVNMAAQVFSCRVSSVMRGLHRLGNGCLSASSGDTADFLLFVDKLFDSVNGSLVEPAHGKLLRCAVKKDSPHIDFWNEAIKVLETVRFFREGNKEFVPPTIKNWIATLRGFKYIWMELSKVGFKFLCPRNLNQDPVENFFGCIRSHGVHNINPTCSAFVCSFKTLVINNFMSAHSPGANCEDDDSEGAINSLQQFIYGTSDTGVVETTSLSTDNEDTEENFSFSKGPDSLALKTHAYIAGYMAKVILRKVGRCSSCRTQLISKTSLPEYDLIEARAYSPKALLRPDTQFIALFGKCNEILHNYLPNICNKSGVIQTILSKIYKFITNHFHCDKHDLFSIFVNIFCKFYIHMWIKNVNRILRGRDVRNINDPVKQIALKRYNKFKTRTDRIKRTKQLV